MRQVVDITKLKRERFPNMIRCTVCNTDLSPVETRSNTVVWYCSKCSMYNEYTTTGIFLMPFKKQLNGGLE